MAFFEAASLALSVGGMLSGRKRRKEEQERLRIQAGEQRLAGQRTEDDLFVEAQAATAQQNLMVEREALAEQAGQESLRQSRLLDEGADVTLGTDTSDSRTRRRKAFFGMDEGSML